MEKQKYYWMLFDFDPIVVEDVTKEHPFIIITKHRNNNPKIGNLLNWKEITKEEYVLFQDILFDITNPKYNF